MCTCFKVRSKGETLIFGPFPLAPLCLTVRPSHLTSPFIVAYLATAAAGMCINHKHILHACKGIVRYVWLCGRKRNGRKQCKLALHVTIAQCKYQ
jgi:hypothetical protein